MQKVDDGLTASARYAMRHRKSGLCTHCANRTDGRHSRCRECLVSMRQAYNNRKAKLLKMKQRSQKVVVLQKRRAAITNDGYVGLKQKGEEK
jgi:hypothetical protein